MAHSDTVWATPEQWGARAFLAAGGLFAVPVIASVLNAVTDAGVVISPAVVFTFLLVALIGLLGLYPRLAERNATVARGCVGLLAVTATTTVLGIGVFAPFTGYPFGETTALATVVAVAVGTTLTVATFGVATLRMGTHSRLVSASLLMMAAGMSSLIATMVIYGHSTPEWVSTAVNGVIATSLGASGFVLRTQNSPADAPRTTDDVPAS